MEVYLPNMELPENCICCDLSHEDGWCPVKQTYTDSYTFKTCPLVPIPEHGDLIERKAVCLTDFEIAMCDGDYKEGMKMLLEKIESAPAIIPADPPKEKP